MNTERKFDRVKQFDDRSRSFRAVADVEVKPLRNYTWPCKTWLDQGSEGACVGFGISHELAAVPMVIGVTNDFALKVYKRAQQLDPWEGEDYDGTSVLAGMKAVQELLDEKGKQYIEKYEWCFSLEEMVKVLGRKGPVILGTDWYSGMYNTDEKGFLHVEGEVVGGHCYLGRGVKLVYKDKREKKTWANVNQDESYVIIHNSWGKDWGTNGTAKISLTDMGKLLASWGECVIPTVRNK